MAPGRTPNLRRLREARGLDRAGLAAEITSRYGAKRGKPVSARTIERWETGETAIPEQHWDELSELFAVSIAFLLGLDDNNGDGVRSAA